MIPSQSRPMVIAFIPEMFFFFFQMFRSLLINRNVKVREMDYNKQIATLQSWREELKAELKTKGISEQERLAIHHSIDVTNKYITTYASKLVNTPTELDIRHSINANSLIDVINFITTLQDAIKLANTPTRETPQQCWEKILQTLFVGVGNGLFFSMWYYMYPNYAPWRHSKWKFSQSQIDFRRHWFHPNFPELPAPASMRLSGRTVGSVCGAVAACLWFLKF